MTQMTVPVKDIKAGDKFIGSWEATSDAHLIPAREPTDYGPVWARVLVRWSDGGDGERVWDDPNITLEVERDSTPHELR